MSLIIEGYASRFYERDLNNDIVTPGAFQTSLLKSGIRAVKMLYQHNTKDLIGVWDTIYEDEVGLFVRGRIMADSSVSRLAMTLSRAGVLDGLSIGFKALKSRKECGQNIRVLTEIELWEISLVTFPMLPSARFHHLEPQVTAA